MMTKAPTTKTIRVEQVGSAQRRRHDQRATLIGLGLNKIGRVRELPDTAMTRGMVRKVNHLVRIIDADKA
ncbi:MAG: 50S ribosomal protein L30 [Proteobacteria bacterium]|nr:50S ribosomal protein L30 [Pseudomonadota bacterium]